MHLFPFSVACSTQTVGKCKAALQTLRGFPYFSPICLCKESHLQPRCNQLRDFLFDHPCEFAKPKGKTQHTVCTIFFNLPGITHKQPSRRLFKKKKVEAQIGQKRDVIYCIVTSLLSFQKFELNSS